MPTRSYLRRQAVTLALATMASFSTACAIRLGTFDHDEGPSQWDETPPSSYVGGQGTTGGSGASTPSCDAITIDREKELFVPAPSLTMTAESARDLFRRTVTPLARGVDPQTFVTRWLATWKDRTLPSSSVMMVPRATVDSVLVCPWLKQTPSNACDATCGYCAERKLDLAKAPFRLTAVVNREDLGIEEGACGRLGGEPAAAELRLLYTVVRPGTEEPLPFSVIFEYDAGARSLADLRVLARRWHALSTLQGQPLLTALEDLVESVGGATATGTLPRLHAVRTNEIALGAPLGLPWELREFRYDTSSAETRLVPASLPRTPDLSFDGSGSLTQWLAGNGSQIVSRGPWTLPSALQTGAAWTPSSTFAWSAPGIPAATVDAFNRETCNGCHGALAGGEGFQHVIATGAGIALSPFLRGEGGDSWTAPDGELARRERIHRALLCGEAQDSGSPVPAPSAPPDAGVPSSPSPYGG